MVSSGLTKVEDIIEKRYHPNNWNIYTFYCGDGDNWSINNKETIEAFRRLKEINQIIAYTEIGKLVDYSQHSLYTQPEKRLWDWTKLVEDKNFKRLRLEKNNDIWPSFKRLFGGRS